MLESVNRFIEDIDSLLTHIEFENNRNMFFQSGLKKYIGDSAIEKEFREFVEIKIRPFLINTKTFTYNNAIISLYGCLENYLEAIAKEYINVINERCDQFSRLPNNIKKHHLNASLELLNKVQKSKESSPEYRNKLLKEIVRNIYTCLHEKKAFSINSEAFALHTANFRYDSIHALFQRFGISGISKKCLENSSFVRELSLRHSIDSKVSGKVLISLLIAELDDLAQRRNEIAHGVKTYEIESLDLLRSRIRVIKSYGKAINKVVSEYLDQFLYSTCPKIFIGKPAKIFTKINVFGFSPSADHEDLRSAEICVGDLIYAMNDKSKKKIVAGEIISIRKDNQNLDNLVIPSDISFSIGVNFNITSHMDGREIYVSKAV